MASLDIVFRFTQRRGDREWSRNKASTSILSFYTIFLL